MKRTFQVLIISLYFLSSFAVVGFNAFAQEPVPTALPPFQPSPLPSPPKSPSVKPVTITYEGQGSANFKEIYSETNPSCGGVRTNTSNEDATELIWNAVWKTKPIAEFSSYPTSASFLGKSARTDSDDCGGQPFICSSDLNFAQDHFPVMKVEKSGKKGLLVTISAEEQLDGYSPTGSACGQSSVFDNAITGGLNQQNVTEIRIKLNPAKKNNKKTFKFENKNTFDCTDPAKSISFISNTCTLTMNLSGSVTVNGKWSAKLQK